MSRLHALALLRLSLGWIFLWAFLDKLFGLGFATTPAKAWLTEGSPTTGFLSHSTGPFSPFFQSLAGQAWVDWMFMMSLLLIGLALILGVGMKIATRSAMILMLLMWLAVFPKANNPFMDDHLIYLFALEVLYRAGKDHVWSLTSWWSKTSLVKSHPWLA